MTAVATIIQSLPFALPKKDVFLSALQVFIASLFLALCSQISIPLYFSPVPLSGQTFGIMLIGACMGSRKGLLSVLAYLAEGSLGLPVFASGSSGIISLLGPTGGYFLGFLLQTYLVGWFVERQTSFQMAKTLPILLLSCQLQLALGVLWLSFFVNFETALVMGLYPFLVGETIKSVAVCLCLKTQRHLA
jgi:biotin transport system substrate-specific component